LTKSFAFCLGSFRAAKTPWVNWEDTVLPADLQTLVNNFHDQIESYKNPSYNETQLRRDFLDKFIKILGWDVDNEKAYAESFREVIHEDRIRISGQTKAPDYCIQSNGGRLFYIEAKSPR
jgi:hypothetical protein